MGVHTRNYACYESFIPVRLQTPLSTARLRFRRRPCCDDTGYCLVCSDRPILVSIFSRLVVAGVSIVDDLVAPPLRSEMTYRFRLPRSNPHSWRSSSLGRARAVGKGMCVCMPVHRFVIKICTVLLKRWVELNSTTIPRLPLHDAVGSTMASLVQRVRSQPGHVASRASRATAHRFVTGIYFSSRV